MGYQYHGMLCKIKPDFVELTAVERALCSAPCHNKNILRAAVLNIQVIESEVLKATAKKYLSSKKHCSNTLLSLIKVMLKIRVMTTK